MKMRGQSSAEEHSSLIPDPSSCLARRLFGPSGRLGRRRRGRGRSLRDRHRGFSQSAGPEEPQRPVSASGLASTWCPRTARPRSFPSSGTIPTPGPISRPSRSARSSCGAVGGLAAAGTARPGLAAAGTAAPGLAAAGRSPRRSWRFRWFARMPAARSISSHRRAAAVSSAPATRPVSTSLAAHEGQVA